MTADATRVFTLITGASSGIGRQTAIDLSTSRRLILHGRNRDKIEETRALCKSPADHLVWQFDLNEIDRLESSLVELIPAKNGQPPELSIEGFVHCAGVANVLPIRSTTRAALVAIMNVNFASAAEIVRLLVQRTINDKSLRNIVFVSSTASQFGARGFSLYSASKGALDSLMRALAVELAPHVRVNSVLPGAVRTAMSESILQDPKVLERLQASYPLGLGEPRDISAVIDFLLSDKARWITGQQLVVDGGRSVNITA